MYGLYVVGLLVALGVGGYAAYWSFGLRRSLRVRAYASQVSVVGLFSVYGAGLVGLFYVTYFLAPGLRGSPLGTLQEALYVVLAPIALAWVDSSARLGRRSDPLLRDSLGWSLRLVLWPVLLLSLCGYAFQGEDSGIALISYAVVAVSAAPALMTARRSGDPTVAGASSGRGCARAPPPPARPRSR